MINPVKKPAVVVLALWAAGLGAAAQYAKISVIFDLLPAAYPDAGASLGFLVSFVGVVGIALGVVAGLLVARIRYRRALLWGLWIGAGCSFAQSMLPPFGWMLASRVMEGVSHLAIVVAAPTLIAQISAPRHRSLALTLWGTFFGVAFAILTWFGLPLVEVKGISALFTAHAIYMVVFAMALSLILQRLEAETESPPFSLVHLLRDHIEIYRSPYLSAPALGWLFYTFCYVSILTVLPPFIAQHQRAFVMGTMPLAGIAVSLLIGVQLLRYLSAIKVIELGFALAAASMIWLFLAPGLPAACIALAGAMGLVQGASFASVAQLNDTAAQQAKANGAMAQMGNLGNSIGTPVVAAAIAAAGHTGLVFVAMGALMAGMLTHIILAGRRR